MINPANPGPRLNPPGNVIMAAAPTPTMTPQELSDRFIQACALQQPFDWEKIRRHLQDWTVAGKLGEPEIVRLETLAQVQQAAATDKLTRTAKSRTYSSARRRVDTRVNNQTREEMHEEKSKLIEYHLWFFMVG